MHRLPTHIAQHQTDLQILRLQSRQDTPTGVWADANSRLLSFPSVMAGSRRPQKSRKAHDTSHMQLRRCVKVVHSYSNTILAWQSQQEGMLHTNR